MKQLYYENELIGRTIKKSTVYENKLILLFDDNTFAVYKEDDANEPDFAILWMDRYDIVPDVFNIGELNRVGILDNEQFKKLWNKFEKIHPTQKPVDLFRYLIKTYSNEGETVYDGYSGSGTTAIACIKEQRKFIGAELNKEYYNKAMERIKSEQAKLVLF